MSFTSRFPYTLIQQLQKDVDSLSRAVTDLQNTTAADGSLLVSLQNTINSVCAVLSSDETNANSMFMYPTFTDCTVGTLNYLDDLGTPHDLENVLQCRCKINCW